MVKSKPTLKRRSVRREVEKIIAQCRLTIKRGADPFQIDVKSSLGVLRNFLKSASTLDDICLDGEAIYNLSTVVESQDRWVKFRSSRLFVDPILIESRIKSISNKVLARIFVSCWTPIASIETLTIPSIDLAIDYWNRLKPIKSRWGRLPKGSMKHLTLSPDEASRLGLIYDRRFEEQLSSIEEQIRKLLASEGGRVEYSIIVRGKDWIEAVTKAYLVSFLVSSGRIGMTYDPSTDKFYITPYSNYDKPKSIAISIGIGG
ncbi:MAG: hypothetical protein QXQ29_06190 [Candidatus Bathyarchaeia archaeon]|nr:hypothetical protein [Candidatus Bathyarchaeota archaeon]